MVFDTTTLRVDSGSKEGASASPVWRNLLKISIEKPVVLAIRSGGNFPVSTAWLVGPGEASDLTSGRRVAERGGDRERTLIFCPSDRCAKRSY